MPYLKTYDIFISHAWRYSDDYKRLVELLNEAQNFKWRNYSDPKHDPVIDPDDEVSREKLVEELEEQIRPTNCVIVISGMYVAYRYWIQKEIDIATHYRKPIIGVKPWGQERTPQKVQDVAVEIVGWNTDSIVSAIRRYAL
jgi:hypothetical protein